MVKPDAIKRLGPIMEIIINNGFKISRARMARFKPEQVDVFYEEHVDKSFYG